MITPPSHQNRFLLYIEPELISIAFAAIFATILKRLHSLLHDTPFPFISIFGATSGISAVVLGVSIAAAVQDRQAFVRISRMLYPIPFVAAIVYGALLTVKFQGSVQALSVAGAAGGGAILIGTGAVLMITCKILDELHGNMVRAAARDNNKDGLLFLHHVCRLIIGVCRILPSPESQDSIGLQSLGNVRIWLSMTRSQLSYQVQTPSEEEVALLGAESDTGEKIV